MRWLLAPAGVGGSQSVRSDPFSQISSVSQTTSVRCGALPIAYGHIERFTVGSVIKKRRKRMAKKKHRKLLKRTRIQRRRAGK